VSKANGEFLLDTNCVIAFLANDPQAAAWIDTAESLGSPVVCLGELEYGALRSGNPEKNLGQLARFLSQCEVLHCTRDTARCYALVRANLARKGRPIPEADLWIAATCMQKGFMPLLSADGHFDEVDDLIRLDWNRPIPKRRKRKRRQ
jgi:tRNA(fMet)-specific endonuclease VapC